MVSPSLYPGTALICAIHRTTKWWRHVGDHLGFERAITVSDVRGDGELNVVDDFYAAFRRYHEADARYSSELTADEVEDVIARCRVLRWLPERRARAMVLGMGDAHSRVLDRTTPAAGVAFPVDRYPTDVLMRLARKRGVPFYELTASALPNMAMLLFRGHLVHRSRDPDTDYRERKRHEISDPLFTPSYVQGQSAFDRTKFLKVFGYFRLRAWAFRAISIAKRDPLNLQYVDAQNWLGHKPTLRDLAITTLVDRDWRAKLEGFPRDKRLFMALQLFPEASIDYWIDNRELIEHEPLLLKVARAFSAAGFLLLVKDHPLQYGFRQVALIEELRRLPNVVIVPYEVSGNELVGLCGANFTCTGTLGLQAALMGIHSVVVPNYYSNPADFIEFSGLGEVEGLPGRVVEARTPEDLRARQTRIVDNLLRGSFEADFFSYRKFGSRETMDGAAMLGRALGEQMHALGPEGEDWHRRNGF